MNNDDLDRILSHEEEIVPSSGFAESVMSAVRTDAAAPPPIPFPWKQAIPALVAGAVAMIVMIAAAVRSAAEPPPVLKFLPVPHVDIIFIPSDHWMAVAVLLSIVSVFVSLRFARRGV